MDSRQSQHSFNRPQDRPLIQNPNHQAGPQSQHPAFPSYTPSSQPTVHVPYNDLFPRRDPFLPTSQSQRQDSYNPHRRDGSSGLHTDRPSLGGSWGGTNGTPNVNPPALQHHPASHAHHPQHPPQPQQQEQQLQQNRNVPPPPPPPSVSSANQSSSYILDSARRRSLGTSGPANGGAATSGGSGSPRAYYGASHDPPPPPTVYGGRNMPPPSPPQQQLQNSAQPYHSSRAPQPPHFPAGRDLPSLTSGHRPGSSMSISSLIGSDPTSGSQQPHHSPPASTVAAPSPSMKSMQPPSPRRAYSTGPRRDYSQYSRPKTPDKYAPNPTTRPSDPPSVNAGSPTRLYGSNQGSPEARPSLAQPYQYRQPSNYSPHSRHTSIHEAHGRENTRAPPSNIPPRPNSQPTSRLPPQREPEFRDGLGPHIQRHTNPQLEERKAAEDALSRRYAEVEHRERGLFNVGGRDRPVSIQPTSHAAYSSPQDHRAINESGEPPQASHHWRGPSREEPSRASSNSLREEQEFLSRNGYRNPSASQSPFANPPRTDDIMRPISLLERNNGRALEQYSAPPTSDPHSERRVIGYLQRSSSFDQMTRKHGEEMQRQRSFLNVSPETARKAGRASPLPQAVQGAQAQLVGPSGDPSIKSEFGRPFSGLGGGFITPLPGNGTSTPLRGSPVPQNGAESLPAHVSDDLERTKLVRTDSSRSGRKGRRVKDEEGRNDSEGDGRGTPTLNGRGSKRSKYSHPVPHHHHHPHGHHHHHHHHKAEEDSPMPASSHPASASGTPFNAQKFNSTITSNPGVTPSTHHHHHHHATHHHHHAVPKANPALFPLPKKPLTTVISEPLIKSVEHLPRNHLGSKLYSPQLDIPSSQSQMLHAKFGYMSYATPIPKFDDKSNCTFTIRVPRYFLTREQREQICTARNVWGTEVYTDDSDPLAAAIHDGWIRGEWDEEDEKVLVDVELQGSQEPEMPEILGSRPTSGPVVPPLEMDLHITILILPALEQYGSTVQHGIKSRSWPSNHDGMSFKIHQLQWVDEGNSRGEERGAEARRKRLHAAMSLVSLLTGDNKSRTSSSGNTPGNSARLAGVTA